MKESSELQLEVDHEDRKAPSPEVTYSEDSDGLVISTGITGISVGVNGASLPPAVPKAFVWRDESSKEEVGSSLCASL